MLAAVTVALGLYYYTTGRVLKFAYFAKFKIEIGDRTSAPIGPHSANISCTQRRQLTKLKNLIHYMDVHNLPDETECNLIQSSSTHVFPLLF